jgi:hypothetical protein
VPKPAVLLSPRFNAAIRRLSDADFVRIEAALQAIPDCFGQPHTQSGISIRRLRKNIFECRAGLKVRLLFRQNGRDLEFFFVGNHDEVAAWFKPFRIQSQDCKTFVLTASAAATSAQPRA